MTCCGCGPAWLLFARRATCTPARWRCGAITAARSRTASKACVRCRELGLTRRPAIAAIAFGRRTMPVDGNIERVVSRLFAVEQPLPQAKPLIQQLASTLLAHPAPATRSRAPATWSHAPGDSAQALMDLGSSICTPKKPACALCPLTRIVWRAGVAIRKRFHAKQRRKPGPLRRGAAYHRYAWR